MLLGHEVRFNELAHRHNPTLVFHFIGEQLFQLVTQRVQETATKGRIDTFWAIVGGQT